jgi:hypothetical protein
MGSELLVPSNAIGKEWLNITAKAKINRTCVKEFSVLVRFADWQIIASFWFR